MADEVIRFNGFPFLEKEDKEADDDSFVEPSEPAPCRAFGSTRRRLMNSRSCDEAGSDHHESIRYAITGDQYVSLSSSAVRDKTLRRTTGEIVQSTSYQGFPVVRSDDDRTIIGFVNKVELRYALGKFRPL